MIKCLICDKMYKTNNVLGRHIREVHSYTNKQYYDEFLLIPGEEICKYDKCSNVTTYRTGGEGYLDYCSTTCQNLDRPPATYNRVSDTLKGRAPGNKGKTVETDKRLGYLTGSKNPFYGKDQSGENNPMYGKFFYDVGVEKYGPERADELGAEYLENRPDMSGENNPMYQTNLHEIGTKKYGKKEADRKGNSGLEKHKDFSIPNYNPDSILIIENYGKENGYNFQHAENGGEVRIGKYFVDGYDKENNVVLEYYEKAHRNKVDYDNKRMKEIIEKKDCTFIIIRSGDEEVEIHNE